MLAVGLTFTSLAGCQRQDSAGVPAPAIHKHEHKPPHGGTPVALGQEAYHIELVLDRPSGRLRAYVLDGEMENFVRLRMDSFEVIVLNGAKEERLVFNAVPNNATGETVGDTALFEAQAAWLRTTPAFEGLLRKLTVRGSDYENITFTFPQGNDTDEDPK